MSSSIERSGGHPTWEQIARDHGRFVYNIAYRLTGNHDDAQDLVQETMIRVRRGLDSFQPGSMEAWLSRITTNLFLDEVRRKRRRPVDVVAELPDPLIAVSAEPDAELAKRHLPAEIQAALLKLPADFRAAVVLCDVVGMDYAEIADALDVPPGTVRSRIHRGRAMLRGALS